MGLATWRQDSRAPFRFRLTQRNTKRKISFVGPVVAADSEQNLRTLRFSGASGVASARFGQTNLAMVGNPSGGAPFAPGFAPGASSECCTHAGMCLHLGPRHRRIAPELA